MKRASVLVALAALCGLMMPGESRAFLGLFRNRSVTRIVQRGPAANVQKVVVKQQIQKVQVLKVHVQQVVQKVQVQKVVQVQEVQHVQKVIVQPVQAFYAVQQYAAPLAVQSYATGCPSEVQQLRQEVQQLRQSLAMPPAK